MTFVDNGNGTGTLSGHAGRRHGRQLRAHVHGDQRRPAERHADLHADRQPGAGDHQRGQRRPSRSARPGIFTVTTTGFPAPTLTLGGAALPAGVTFVDNGNGTGTLSGTPAAGTGGTYAITFTATNGVGSTAPQAFTLTVNGPPGDHERESTTFTVGTPGHLHGDGDRQPDAGDRR